MKERFNKFDRWLLQHYPIIWRSGIHLFLLFSFLIGNGIFFLLGLLQSHFGDESFLFARQINIQAAILNLILIPILIIWYSRLRAFPIGYQFKGGYFVSLLLYIFCLLVILSNTITLTSSPSYKVYKVASIVSDEEFNRDYNFHFNENFWCCNPKISDYQEKALIDVIEFSFEKYNLEAPEIIIGYSTCDSIKSYFESIPKNDIDTLNYVPCLVSNFSLPNKPVSLVSSVLPLQNKLETIFSAKEIFKSLYFHSIHYIIGFLIILSIVLICINLPRHVWGATFIFKRPFGNFFLNSSKSVKANPIKEFLALKWPLIWYANLSNGVFIFLIWISIATILALFSVYNFFQESTIISFGFLNEILYLFYLVIVIAWSITQKQIRFNFYFPIKTAVILFSLVCLLSFLALGWALSMIYFIDPLQLNYFNPFRQFYIFFSINYLLVALLTLRQIIRPSILFILFIISLILFLLRFSFLIDLDLDLFQKFRKYIGYWGVRNFVVVYILGFLYVFLGKKITKRVLKLDHFLGIILFLVYPSWWLIHFIHTDSSFDLLSFLPQNSLLLIFLFVLTNFLLYLLIGPLLLREIFVNSFEKRTIRIK